MYQRIKKDTKWSILELGKFDIDLIKEEISNFSEEWLLDTSRQNLGMVHKTTEMFRICATPYEWSPTDPVITTQYNSFKNVGAQEQLNKIYNTLEQYYSGKIIRCEVIKLYAGTEIYKHIDGGALLNYSRRVHIPIITNELVTFTVMNDSINMKESLWYEINNQMPHAVKNSSTQDRVHIIIDILPDDMLNYTKLGE